MSYNPFETQGDEAVGSGTGSVKMLDSTARDSSGFITIVQTDGSKMYVPYFYSIGLPGAYDNTYSLNFDGVDEYLEGTLDSSSPIKSVTTAFSMSIWVNTSTGGGKKGIGVWYGSSRWATLGFGSADRAAFDVKTSGGRTIHLSSTSALDDGNWHFLVGTFDGSNCRVYVDGTLETTASQSGQFNDTGNIFTTMRIGRNVFTYTAYWGGHLDEGAMWDVVLSDADVTALYNSGVPNDLRSSGSYDTDRTSNLIGWWRNGDGTEGASGTTVYDMSGISDTTDLTMNNMEEPGDYASEVPT